MNRRSRNKRKEALKLEKELDTSEERTQELENQAQEQQEVNDLLENEIVLAETDAEPFII